MPTINKNKLSDIARPVNKKAPWREVVQWNKKYEEVLDDLLIIAIRIKKELNSTGKSQTDLAEELGVKPQALTRIMKGKQNLTILKIRQIERVLNISLIAIKKSNHNSSQVRTKFIPVKLHYNHSIKGYNGPVGNSLKQRSKQQQKRENGNLSIAS